MRWEAHTRTAQKILQDFDAYHFQKYEKDLINGIIYPDANDPKSHFGREETIQENVRKARERRLDYNPSDSFFYLGIAFHYIQDSWVGMDPDHEEYPNYEKKMDKCTLLDRNESMFQYYPVMRSRVLTQFMDLENRLNTPVKTPSDMYELVSIGKPFESTAFLDVNFAYRICHRVAEMVLQPMLKVSLDERLSKLHKEYKGRLVEKEKSERGELFLMEESLGKPSEGTLSGIDTWNKRRTLNKRTVLYGKRKHLDKVFNSYKQETVLLVAPFIEWFNVQIPELVLPEPESVVEEAIFPLAMPRDAPLPLL